MKSTKAAICQIFCLDGVRRGNFVRIENAIREAKDAGADIACFPETALLGWINPDAHKRARPVPGEDSDRLCKLAKDYNIYLCVGIPSSRKIEKATYYQIPFRVIATDQHPDHDAIAEFRKRHLKALSGLFVQALLLCRQVGLVKLGHVSLDGTKVIVENWRLEYNNHRPHSSLGYMTPAAFAAGCNPPGSATLRLPDCRIKNVDNSLIKVDT